MEMTEANDTAAHERRPHGAAERLTSLGSGKSLTLRDANGRPA